MDLGQILRELNGVATTPVRTGKRARAEVRQPADSNCRQPTVFGGLRNSLNTKLRRDSADECAGWLRGSAEAAVTKTRFIDQGRRERVGFADSQVNPAIREIPPAKSGVVAKTREIAGKIRVAPTITDSTEQLIALAEILVHAHIEVVIVVRLAAVREIVVCETRTICSGIKLQQLQCVGVNASGGQLIHQIHLGGGREICHSGNASARVERIAHKTRTGGNQASRRIGRTGGNRASGCRIENGSTVK